MPASSKKKKNARVSHKERKQIQEVANSIPHLIANQMLHTNEEHTEDDVLDSAADHDHPSHRNNAPRPPSHDPHRAKKMSIIWVSVIACMGVIAGSWFVHMRATWYDVARNEGSEQALAKKISQDFSAIAKSFDTLNVPATVATSTTSTDQNTPTEAPSPTQTIESLLRAQLDKLTPSSTEKIPTTSPKNTTSTSE